MRGTVTDDAIAVTSVTTTRNSNQQQQRVPLLRAARRKSTDARSAPNILFLGFLLPPQRNTCLSCFTVRS